jgi:CofH subfamily radical SAM domain protein
VTYALGGNIDYTNVCVVACKFCAYYRPRQTPQAFVISFDDAVREMEALRAIGGREVCIQGGVNPALPFSWYLDFFGRLKRLYPEIHIDALSPEEVLGLERFTGHAAPKLFRRLREVGVDGMPAAAAEILVDEVRQRIAPSRIGVADWLRIVEAALEAGLHVPWVGMVIGFGESVGQRIEHLLLLRDLQDRVRSRFGRGIAAFKVWLARLEPTRLGREIPAPDPGAGAVEYLRWVAISRLALDNFENHRAVWRTMGFDVARAALRAGANDVCCTGSINAIDAVMRARGGAPPGPALAERIVHHVVRIVLEAGFEPALRDPFYTVIGRPDVEAALARGRSSYLPGVGFVPEEGSPRVAVA